MEKLLDILFERLATATAAAMILAALVARHGFGVSYGLIAFVMIGIALLVAGYLYDTADDHEDQR